MHEIGMQAPRPERDPVEQRMRPAGVERVPAHVRNLQLRIGRRDAVDLAGNPTQALDHLVFAAALRHQLHADADAEERPALATHRFLERLDHALDRIESAAAIRKRADAGQHDAVGPAHRVRVSGHHDRLVASGLARRTLERLGGRMQVARAVIDDRHGHGRPPGWGNRPITSS